MNSYQIDAAYRPFPGFHEWIGLTVDQARWDRTVAMLPPAGSVSPQDIAQAHRIAMRAAAVDTGAIEGLYDVDRGFTMTIALQTATWEAVLNSRGEKVRSLIESQMQAYEYVIDLSTGREPISEMWIRTLHERITESQDRYQVLTEVGWQNHPLPQGQYKLMPNHVRLQDGGFHAYAPVDLVPVKMHRLVEELRSEAFQHAHPVVQAAYAHYALVCIHPFADGNGRVARALASVFTFRSHSVPLLILLEHKPQYLAALRSADAGDAGVFVNFVFDRTLDAISLIAETLRAAAAPDPEVEIATLANALGRSHELDHEEFDRAALSLATAFVDEFTRATNDLSIPGQVKISSELLRHIGRQVRQARFRLTPDSLHVQTKVAANPPYGPVVRRVLAVEVPMASDVGETVLMVDMGGSVVFSASVRELLPTPTTSLQIRLRVAVRRVLGEELATLTRKQAQL